jgi:phenylpropionate dioxygenase-like ring-hydroxylating dioxygenase large terminal subunit
MAPETQDFLRNCWYVAAWDYELIDGKLLARVLLDNPTVLYRGESGRIVALDNRCAHRGAKLSNGRREGDCVRCMYHGLKFDATGKCVADTCVPFFASGCSQTSDCCSPCSTLGMAPCFVCLQGQCIGAP